jgi:hypothetical protein
LFLLFAEKKLIVVAVFLYFRLLPHTLLTAVFSLSFKGLIMETVNELIYTPKGERDYGTLACFGTNSIGKQMEPCLFQVVPAGTYEIMQHFRVKLLS